MLTAEQHNRRHGAGLSGGQRAARSPCPAPGPCRPDPPPRPPLTPAKPTGRDTHSFWENFPCTYTHDGSGGQGARGQDMGPTRRSGHSGGGAAGRGGASAGRSSGRSRPGTPGEDGRGRPFRRHPAHGCRQLDVGSPGLGVNREKAGPCVRSPRPGCGVPLRQRALTGVCRRRSTKGGSEGGAPPGEQGPFCDTSRNLLLF